MSWLGSAFQAFFWRTLWRAAAARAGRDPLLLALVLGLAGSMADFLAHGLVDVGYFASTWPLCFSCLLALLQRLDRRCSNTERDDRVQDMKLIGGE